MKKLHEAITELKKLRKQGYPNVSLCYNFLSNKYWVNIYSHTFLQNKFNKTHEIIL